MENLRQIVAFEEPEIPQTPKAFDLRKTSLDLRVASLHGLRALELFTL
ncbi:MAG: hypothetical protein LBR11_09435 [Deltaproteobacteria bacterium]|nr:hypothetical protein [Deltaproteobacteria bacterium]